MKEIVGSLQAQDFRFGIVVAHFNEFVTRKLLEGALEGLKRHGSNLNQTTVVWVPGSFDIPVTAKKMATSGRYDALITLGAIIRGSTPHFDYVAGQTASGIAAVSNETGIPVIFGVLTTDTIEQAIERAGAKMGNKGFDAARSAIEMAHVMSELDILHLEKVNQYAMQSS